MKRRGLKLLLVLAGVVLSLSGAEVVLRLFSSVGPRSGYLVPEPVFHALTSRTFVWQPRYSGRLISRDFRIPYQLNSLGFRERELDFSSLRPLRPFLFVGDSYFNGWGVEVDARLSEDVVRKLARNGEQIPSVNLAFPGFGTYQTLDVLNLYATKLDPRLIVLGFFVGNDFTDNAEAAALSRVDAGPIAGSRASAIIRSFVRTSPVVNLARNALWESAAFRYVFDRLEIQNDRLVLYERRQTSRQEQLYAVTLRALDELAEFSRRSGLPILVVLVPDHLQVLRPEFFSSYDIGKPQHRLRAHLETINLPYLDLLESFQRAQNPAELFFKADKHWNAMGHDFVARVLVEHISARPRIATPRSQ